MWQFMDIRWSLVSPKSKLCIVTDNCSHLADLEVMNGLWMKELSAGKSALRDFIIK